MSQSTTPNAANTEPRLCKSGCGFFGSGATEGFCSKCFLSNQKKLNSCQAVVQASQPRPEPEVIQQQDVTFNETPQPMDIEPPTANNNNSTAETTTVTSPAKKDETILKKKKKKTSYKAMMAAMTTSDAPRDIEKEKEAIRKATGGGAFSKIDKI